MTTDPIEIEKLLLSRPLPGVLPADLGWIMPAYDGLSIANLPSTIAHLLGVELPGALPALPGELWLEWLPGVRRVVLVLLDALGWQALRDMQAAGEAEAFSLLAGAPGDGGRLVPLTSVFPSTTAAALTSLRTGHAPASHGWLAYEMYLRELGVAANAIRLCPVWTGAGDQLVQWGLDVERMVPLPCLAQVLSGAGVVTRSLLHLGMVDSGFTRMLHKGAGAIWGHYHASDFWVQLRRLLAETRGQRAFISAYWSGLDTVGHGYGHDGEAWAAELRDVAHLLKREFLDPLPAADRDGTLLLITSDHGQIRVTHDRIVTAADDRELSRQLLVPVMGESRAAFVYPRPGRAEAIREYLAARWPGWYVVLSSGEAIEAGLMGQPVADETWARAGELLILPVENYALQRAKPLVALESRHGGLMPEEMMVPLLGTRLEAVR